MDSEIPLIDRLSPMMRQYYELKERCKESVLFFRLGDFYEVFAEDAVLIAPLLDLTLTSRERGDSQKVKFCGVPHHAASGYWLKLLKAGFKVSIADQIEEASAAKGLVKRDIVRSLSPGCIYDLEGLDQDSPNYLLALYEKPESNSIALAFADISTGELRLGSCSSFNELAPLVERLRPREILCRRFCLSQIRDLLKVYRDQNPLAFSEMPEAILRDSGAQKALLEHLGSDFLQADGELAQVPGGLEVVSGLLQYYVSLKASLGQFLSIKGIFDPRAMILDEIVVRDLELFETARNRQKKGGLFRLVNFCKTPMGARFFRWSLIQPLLEKNEILARQDAVGAMLSQSEGFLPALREKIDGISDLERLSTRVLLKNARPIELAKIRNSLLAIRRLSETLGNFPEFQKLALLKEPLVCLSAANSALSLLESSLQENPGLLGSGMEVFAPGFDVKLDEMVHLAQNSEEAVESYLAGLREKTGISSLKIRKHKSFGLLIEVTKTNLARVPAYFIRRQTMVNGERFVTSDLQELDDALASASEQGVIREAALYEDLLARLALEVKVIRNVSEALALIDFIQSLAYLAKTHDYTRPKISENGDLKLLGARHPVVEHFIGRQKFVPNNIFLEKNAKQMLITGPNMAGKSTVMRITAICAILNQIGSYIPCREAELPLFDRIFTRVGAFDDLASGLSTFMVEMKESAHILRQATSRSLVILDEVGRGTSTQDGLAIASAILEYLKREVKSWLMFATHYHELVPLAHQLGQVSVMQIQVSQNGDGITFSHLLVPGASGNSFGLEVAQLAGVPEVVLKRARFFLSQGAPAERHQKAGEEALLFRPETPAERSGLAELARRIEQVKINRMTPLQALNLLDDLKNFLLLPQTPGLFEDRQNLS